MAVGITEVEIDILKAATRAEEMIGGLTETSLKFHEFTSAMAVLIGSMAGEYGIDSMIMIQDIESIVNKLEFEDGE